MHRSFWKRQRWLGGQTANAFGDGTEVFFTRHRVIKLAVLPALDHKHEKVGEIVPTVHSSLAGNSRSLSPRSQALDWTPSRPGLLDDIERGSYLQT